MKGIASFRVLSSLAPISTDACDNDPRACRRGTATRVQHITPHGHVKESRCPLDDARNSSRSLLIMSPSPAREGSANAGSSSGNLEEKPRLSEHEKKANHIASGIYPLLPFLSHCLLPYACDSSDAHCQFAEQKRRQVIREGFDRLTELVPGLEGQGRSESVVLKKTVDYIRLQLEERRRLIAKIEELGGHVEDGMRRA